MRAVASRATSWRRISVPFVFLVTVYIGLDLSLPGMPGAFQFDPAESVESARQSRDGGEVVVAPALAPRPESVTLVRTPPVAPSRVAPRHHARWSPRRAPAVTVPEPAPASEESH
jgi:hypothetical protein